MKQIAKFYLEVKANLDWNWNLSYFRIQLTRIRINWRTRKLFN